MKVTEGTWSKLKGVFNIYYQVDERGVAPRTLIVIAFFRWPPIKCCADKVLIDLGDLTCNVYYYSGLFHVGSKSNTK